jgi:hypothetical protein
MVRMDDDEPVPREPTTEDQYAFLFGSDAGRLVIADILFSLCSFGSILDPDDREQIVRHNMGIEILSKCGYVLGWGPKASRVS